MKLDLDFGVPGEHRISSEQTDTTSASKSPATIKSDPFNTISPFDTGKKKLEQQLTPVNRMFQGRSVFITGASGFIGRVLLEKLLRTYQGINRIYILMRCKKNQQPKERLQKQLLKVPIFDKIRSIDKENEISNGANNNNKLLDKIVVIPGDIGEPDLGISEADMNMMLEDKTLSIVFHSAATVKFDEPLKVSVKLNLIATKTIIEICRKLPNLVSLCHVSTAYVNSDIKDNQIIEEKLYPINNGEIKPDNLVQMADIMSEDLMQELKVKLIDQRPNTYTYSKALAEHLIVEQATDLPVSIVRPSIVVASWKEPLKGWIDNLNGPTGLILAIGKGLLRSMRVTRDIKADIVPVDIVVNTMIASAFYAAKINNKLDLASPPSYNEIEFRNKREKIESESEETKNKEIDSCLDKKKKEANGKTINTTTTISKTNIDDKIQKEVQKPPIIHCNSGHLNPITWGKMEDFFFPIIRHYPSCQVFRYPFGSFKSNKYHDLFTRIFVHYLPALILDMLSIMIFREKGQLLSIYNKLHSATGALSHFCNQNYNYQSNNIKLLRDSLKDEQDKQDLYMDIENLDWCNFWNDYVLGAR